MIHAEGAVARADTPAALVDLDVVQRNIARFQSYADAHGLSVRPHVKTHKMPAIARMQLAAGACGITCQKISEAEAMVAGDEAIRDVLITYNIIGEAKLNRLRALAQRVTLSVVADNGAVIGGLDPAFAGASQPLPVLVECNTGADRCGVGSPEEAAALAKAIAAAPNLKFGGLMTYPPAGAERRVEQFMREAKTRIEATGVDVPAISSGGTPTMMRAAEAPVVTEYRPGTYVYNDRSLVARGACGWEDCALVVLAAVVSVPAANRAVIDAGSKVLTSDLLGLEGHGHVLGRDDIAIDQLSEEHGRLTSSGPINLAVGDLVRIVPNHVCVVVNMLDEIFVTGQGRTTCERWRVAARGCVV